MDCLVTKLKGVVNDDSLMTLDEFRLTFDKATDVLKNSSYTHGYVILAVTKPVTIKVIGTGYIGLEDTSVAQTSLEFNNSSDTNVYLTDDVEAISISNKHALQALRVHYTRDLSNFDVGKLRFLENLKDIEIWSDNMYGDITNLYTLQPTENVISFILLPKEEKFNKNITGDLGAVIDRIDLQKSIWFNLTLKAINVTGNIKKLPYSFNVDAPISVNFDSIELGKNNNSSMYSFNSGSNRTLASQITVSGNINKLKPYNYKNIQIQRDHIGNMAGKLSGDFIDTFAGEDKALDTLRLSAVYCDEVQDLSKSKAAKLTYVDMSHNTEQYHVPCKWTKGQYTGTIFGINNVYMSSGTEDMIVDLSSKELNSNANQSYQRAIKINSLDLSSETEGITSAISTLSGKGVTVSITYLGGARALSLARAASKYAIVYKGNELIVEPMNLSNSTVSAAYDCTYKEFNSLEEAKAFVSSNGLVKAESK